MLDTKPLLLVSNFPPIKRGSLDTLQVNLGYLCNLSCTHCHVGAGPKRTELMDKDTINTVLEVIKAQNIKTLDLTGGAPEMNPHFRYLVTQARKLGVEVIDRCNLTILLEPGYEELAQFLVDEKVTIVASLPCYTEQNVDAQRGKGVFEQSIEALQQLNKLGYGTGSLPLHLVYNPGGPFLPPPQEALQRDYKTQLGDLYGIEFDELFSITNMPISRFGSMLLSKGGFYDYMTLLKDNYSSDNLRSVMCKTQISVDWQGNLYDCDFNQMLLIPSEDSQRKSRHINDLLKGDIKDCAIKVADHCYGCTAGQGSSCGGALD
jgi:radical SAM/Cys-rich protein